MLRTDAPRKLIVRRRVEFEREFALRNALHGGRACGGFETVVEIGKEAGGGAEAERSLEFVGSDGRILN